MLSHARGGGLASAAARALADWGFDRLGLAHVVIDREPSNLASGRIAEELGATQAGARLVEHRGSEVELIPYIVDRSPD